MAMEETLNLIEKYLESLDKDLKNLLTSKASKENIDDILFFMEEAKKNLKSILNSLDNSILQIAVNKDKNIDKIN